MPARVTGADRLDRALARLAEEATPRSQHLAAAELVVAAARPLAQSRRVRATGRATARANAGRAVFGSPSVPWTAPSHFSHGTAFNPRPQGGWMKGNLFLFRGRDAALDDVIDLYLTGTVKAARRLGLA